MSEAKNTSDRFERIYIEVTNVCNFKCQFCPYSVMKRRRGYMSLDLLEKILDEISSFRRRPCILFHLMGEPVRTRHIVMRNEEAVISPSWSIHASAGTSNERFIWGMAGDNQTFSDMDAIEVDQLR